MLYLRQVDVRSKKGASILLLELILPVAERRIKQILLETPYLVDKQCKPATFFIEETS